MSRIIRDLDEAKYHADWALSSTGAKTLLECPARFHHQQLHGRPDTAAFDFGHAAHRFILGKGSTIARVDSTDNRRKGVRDELSAVRRNSRVPLDRETYLRGLEVAKAVKRHRLAGPLFRRGEAEVSVFWTDPDTGVDCRARFDWLTQLADGRDAIVDLKTTAEGGASPAAFARSAGNFRYHLQAAWYLAGATAAGLVGPDAVWLWVVVEKAAPHIVTVCQPTQDDLAWGHQLMRDALDEFKSCTLSGVWPAWDDSVETIELPSYIRRSA